MHLYLMQHGEALAEQAAPGRPLSLTGKQQVLSVSRQASRAGIELTALYHSDKLRARQTAEILGDELALDSSEREGLGPKDDVRTVAEWLQNESTDLALVSHLPFLDRLASLLVVGDPTRGIVTFRFGVMVALERGESSWRIDRVFVPES